MPVHVVQSGETLWMISRKYKISISNIISINGLPAGNQLTPGLALYLPQPMSTLRQRQYRTQTGDTFWKIAIRYNTTIEAILDLNPMLASEPSLRPGMVISIPTNQLMELSTLGFSVPYSETAAIQQVTNLAKQLTYLAVAAYTLTDEGYAYVQLEDRNLVSRSLSLGVLPLLMIRNQVDSEFSAELIGRVLGNSSFRANLVQSLVQLVRERRYRGVSIDFEFIPPGRRNDFLTFLRELKNALGPLTLHVNVHAKTTDLPTNPIVGAYDYREIGRIADIVAVMTIDYGYPGGPPDPVSPAWWVEDVILYAISQIIPKKVQIAMPLYGYDKVLPSNTTIGRSALAAQNIALANWRPIQFDEKAKAPFYSYRQNNQEHVVWFEDIRSFISKYNLIDLYQLLGTTYWQIELAAPQNWTYVRNELVVQR
ncbi:LysM peptidoglycan-binding domain-containing protein [Mesobacillus maritimus]|uniref:LysM peptidoglycan-binding domain-containing protein n=1 Tax=Mesobacillus maritimus TaxID=1643336 RepID=UPI0020406676|nr:LysM peptidoglycan-binding domain-containing protein [Mesobacillus maritimus]MCM3586763.1 LysM peptidoglycan-binding domain-containing protein [Mesobacillus maritimus]